MIAINVNTVTTIPPTLCCVVQTTITMAVAYVHWCINTAVRIALDLTVACCTCSPKSNSNDCYCSNKETGNDKCPLTSRYMHYFLGCHRYPAGSGTPSIHLQTGKVIERHLTTSNIGVCLISSQSNDREEAKQCP